VARIKLDAATAAELCKEYGIREISFFGSVTRDDFRADSDVDVLIEFGPDVRVGFFELMDIQDKLTLLLDRKVDLVTKGMLSPFFRDEVLAAREVIYVSPRWLGLRAAYSPSDGKGPNVYGESVRNSVSGKFPCSGCRSPPIGDHRWGHEEG
jgi:predicted nucleotidyltransferase